MHYFTGEVPRWDKWRVFGCDAFNHIPNNKHSKSPGVPTGQRSIFVGFDKDGGSLLFDPTKRRHIHSSNVYYNESFVNRHNALHYFDQRRALLDKGAKQPLQINDFDATSSTQVRNIYLKPDLIRAANNDLSGAGSSVIGRQSNNVGIGGDVGGGVLRNNNDVLQNNKNNKNSRSSVNMDMEANETGDVSVRPLRLVPVGRVEKWTAEHHNFITVADKANFPIKYVLPCPKRRSTPSFRNYVKYSCATTLRQARELGASTADIKWDFEHGFIQFPGHESQLSGHVFSANIISPNSEVSRASQLRPLAFNNALTTIDEEIPDLEFIRLLENRIEMIKLSEAKAERLLAMNVAASISPASSYVDWHIAAEPTHFNQTQMNCCEEWKEWKTAMDDEIASMKLFTVYEELSMDLVPKGRQVLGCKWVYKRKRDKHGNIVRYRARVVALGFRQRAYDSFHPEETYSPVISKDSLRLFLSISAKENLSIYQADVKAAFLQAPLTEEIYMKAPPGYTKQVNGHDVIWKLKRAVYGLKQASACFWTAVSQHLISLGFNSLTGDPCLFQKDLGNGEKILVCCYVDDITYAVSNPAYGEVFLKEMRDRFVIGKDEGNPIEWLLGIAIEQSIEKGTVSMNMSTMIDKLSNLVLTEQERVKAKGIKTPMIVTPLTKNATREVPASEFDYLSVVGSLLHLANCVRCDIAFAVGCLARFSMTPGKSHVKAVKRVVQYLYNTKSMGITYYRDAPNDHTENEDQTFKIYENGLHPLDQTKSVPSLLKVFGDSDYAMDYTRRSTMGIVVMLNGGPVSWTSVLGKTVATSTCEAEINAAVVAVKDAVHLKLMMVEMGLMSKDAPIQILEDNAACIAQAAQGLRHVRNAKHYEVKLRFLQQRVVDREVEFVYCPTDTQLADFFTKPLDDLKFIGFRNRMMSVVTTSNVMM